MHANPDLTSITVSFSSLLFHAWMCKCICTKQKKRYRCRLKIIFRKTHVAELRDPSVSLCSELIKAADGGQISLDWFDNDDSLSHPDPATRPTVLLLPGLTGTSRESYILHMVQQSRDLGYRWVVLARSPGWGPTLCAHSGHRITHGTLCAFRSYLSGVWASCPIQVK